MKVLQVQSLKVRKVSFFFLTFDFIDLMGFMTKRSFFRNPLSSRIWSSEHSGDFIETFACCIIQRISYLSNFISSKFMKRNTITVSC